MKCFRIFCITCLSLMWLVPAWAGTSDVQEKQPAIHIQEKTHTFQQVLEGAKVNHDFIIENRGDAVLKIEKVDTT